MSLRNVIALALIIVSFGLLYPGLTFDLITLKASMNLMGSEIVLFEETRSILGTVRSLMESDNHIVAFMIFFFGVLVPLIKGSILIAVLAMKRGKLRYRLFGFVNAISKWAMSDVFTVGVLVAYLSAKASEGMNAQILEGFYYFAGYCILSILALQFMHLPPDSPIDEPVA